MMYNEIEVFIYGYKVGTIMDDGRDISFFYSQHFKGKGIEISPIKLDTTEIKVPYINSDFPEVYKQLPGIIRDSLPDTNGEAMMDKYFTSQGLDPKKVGVLHRLAFIGNLGMGALEYKPNIKHIENKAFEDIISSRQLYENNKKILHSKEEVEINELMMYLIDSASPLGGAKEKMLIYFNPKTKEIRFYSEKKKYKDFEPYILKFDKDKKINDETTLKEFIYMTLAKLCGIEVANFELLNDGNLNHYLTKRFDRHNGKKVHMATASALLHKPHVKDGIRYEDLFALTYEITNSIEEVKKILRQMIFNILTAVTDDHAKNFSYLMSENGQWKLSPAYDIVYGLGIGALSHRTSLAGKNKNFVYSDVINLTNKYNIKQDDVDEILVHIINSIKDNFKNIANKTKLSPTTRDGIYLEIEERINIFIK